MLCCKCQVFSDSTSDSHLQDLQRVEGEGELDYFGSSDDEDPMDVVFCTLCGGGEDESNLLLCDGGCILLVRQAMPLVSY